MEIDLIIKNYSNNIINLGHSLTYVIDDLYNKNSFDKTITIDDVKMRINIISFILDDIKLSIDNIEILRKKYDKGV